MKKFLILFYITNSIALICSLSARPSATESFSQNSLDNIATKYNSTNLDSIVTYNGDGKTIKKVESYLFSQNNKLASCIEIVNGEKIKYEYEYDNCGNQTLYKISKFIEDQNVYSLKFKEEKAYQNSSDCLSSLLTFHSREGISELESSVYINEKNTYEYSPDGNIMTLTKKDGSGNIFQETTYAYNENRKIETIIIKNLEDLVLVPTSKIEYTYFPASGNINHFESETIYGYSNGNEMKCMKTTYDPSKYSENLFISTIEYYDAEGNRINKEIRTSKFSNNFAMMLESQVEIHDEEYGATTIKYDNKGDVLQITKATSSEANQNAIGKGEWTYDEGNGTDTYS